MTHWRWVARAGGGPSSASPFPSRWRATKRSTTSCWAPPRPGPEPQGRPLSLVIRMKQMARIRQSLRIRPSLRELLRAAGVGKLVPMFIAASAIGAVLEIFVLAIIAQAAVTLSAGADQVDL